MNELALLLLHDDDNDDDDVNDVFFLITKTFQLPSPLKHELLSLNPHLWQYGILANESS